MNTYHLEFLFIFVNLVQLQKLMKKSILTEILFLKRKDKKHQKNVAFYDIVRIKTFISEFKNEKLNKLEKEIKKLREKIMLKDGAKKKRNNTRSIHTTYCLGCKKYTNNMASRSVTMTNKVLR